MTIEAMKQALDALELMRFNGIVDEQWDGKAIEFFDKTIIALRKAIEEAEKQEPVAWKHDCNAILMSNIELWINACPHCGKPRHSSL